MTNIPANLHTIKQRLAAAARAAKRDPVLVKLVAVSKMKSEEEIETAFKSGQKFFGENRVQEAKTKFTSLRAKYPELRLHLIGPLQTNKAEDAVRIFDVIETLDRPRLATELAKVIKKTGYNPEFYIQVNVGEEIQKSGIAPTALGDFLKFCREACRLTVTGLMTLPPQLESPVPHFTHLRQLAERHKLPNLSMGMSGDFEAAIACGATEIRIGTGIFGPRRGTDSQG
jgi:pyridoxal phosphate enzyme (YggS family)